MGNQYIYIVLCIMIFSVPSWPIQRSQEDRQKLEGEKDRKGYTEEDLCSFIPFHNVCPDDLHLRMRISGKLFNQVNIPTVSNCSIQYM